MKVFPLYIGGALLCVVPTFAGELSGQIFIVTNAHESKKLGLVAVALFDEKKVNEAIDSVRAQTLPELTKLQKMMPLIDKFASEALEASFKVQDGYMKRVVPFEVYMKSEALEREAAQIRYDAKDYLRYLLSARLYFKELPQPVATTKTDADGNFAIEIPDGGDFVIGASATRAILSETESYYWLLRVPQSLPAKIILSNDNLTSSGNSILSAGDSGGKDFGSVDTLSRRLNAIAKKIKEQMIAPAQQRSVKKH
jgi:hypothetical protein